MEKLLKKNFVLLKLNAFYGEQYDFGREIGHEHNPGTLIFTPDGAVVSHTMKVLDADTMKRIIEDVLLAYLPLSDAKKLLKKEPEGAHANYAMGCAYYNAGGKKDSDAKKHLEKYLELDKDNKEYQVAETHYRLGVMALRAKRADKDKAKEHFKAAVEMDKTGRFRMKEHCDWAKVQALRRYKNLDVVKKAAREHIDKYPKSVFNGKAYMLIAEICLAQKDIEGAVDAWLELQDKRFGSIEYPAMQVLLKKYWNMSKRSKK